MLKLHFLKRLEMMVDLMTGNPFDLGILADRFVVQKCVYAKPHLDAADQTDQPHHGPEYVLNEAEAYPHVSENLVLEVTR
jgi:hypothetical protein